MTPFIMGVLSALLASMAVADELTIPAGQLDNLGVEFGTPEAVDLVDDFRAPARVRIPPTSDYSVVPIYVGTIKKLGVSPGDHVRKGEPIAWIASREFHFVQTEYIDSFHQLGLSQIRFENDQTLQEEGIVSNRRLAESEHEMEDFRITEQRLGHALNLAGMRDEDITALRKTLILQVDMILRAPVDGVVLEVYTTAGQRIDPSQAVYRIADLSTLWLEIDVPFRKSRYTTLGSTVLVDQGQRTVSATVINVGSRVDEFNQTVVVRAVLEKESDLAPGQFVAAMMTQGQGGEYLLVPSRSVVRKGDQDYVFVRIPDGVVVREVVVTRRAQDRVFIGSGIAANESIVIRGTAALKARWLGIGGGE